MARRRITAKQRAASRRNIRKAQIVSARRRRGTARKPMSRKRKAVIITGVAMGAATGAYAVDRKMNTMNVYHNTSHARARRIHKHGYAPGKEGRRPNIHKVNGRWVAGGNKSHEEGRVFFAAGRNNARFFGPAATRKRVRKKAFYKVAHLDNHPAAYEGGFTNFYFINHSDLGKAGLGGRPRYGRVARAQANVRIRRYRQGMG